MHLVAFHIKKSVFIIYLLEDEQELSLGMLDTSPTYLSFFIVPCYYIICFGCFIYINMLFYIIFGTNLLTQSQVPVSVFFLFLSFTDKEYQTESKWNKTFTMIFLGPEEAYRTWSPSQKIPRQPQPA